MADSSDNPSNYASQNTLIPRAEAIEAVKNGATLCYARSRFYKPTFGEILNVTSNNASDLESGKLNYRNIAHTDEINISVLSITCISMKGPISDADVISGVHGIITIAP